MRNMSASKNDVSVTNLPAFPNTAHWTGHMTNGLGTSYGPEPKAFLTATSEEILLSGTVGTFRIPRVAVTKVGRGNLYPWFFGGVRIHHVMPGLPEELQFNALGTRRRELLKRLAELGYPIV
jgi:hypothetical protein